MIQARSPFVLAIDGFPFPKTIDYISLDLYVWSGDKVTDKPASPQFQIIKNRVEFGNVSDIVPVEISSLIKDYLEPNNGTSADFSYDSLQPFWVEYDATVYFTDSTSTVWGDNDTVLAYLGYNYSKGDFNALSINVAQSNNKVYGLRDNLIRIPIVFEEDFGSGNVTVDWYKNNELKETYTYVYDDNTSNTVNYVNQLGVISYDNFKQKVLDDGGVFEDSNCNRLFFDGYEWGEADRVVISNSGGLVDDVSIDICYLNNCKYKPYKVTFINKFGVHQDVYFLAKSKNRLEYNEEVLKRINRDNSTFSFEPQNHGYTRFNVNSKDSITLNTDYINESYNEVINQLLLSEYVWLTDVQEDESIPVIVKSKNLEVKTSVNDKLINYTIEFQYAHDTIETFF